jgi:glycogen debranching enzyme
VASAVSAAVEALRPTLPAAGGIDDQGVRERARELLLGNVKDGYSRLLGQHYCYIAPAPRTYPFQWFWDTCFHVIALARLGEFDLAKRNLRSLFAMQEEDGFVGHMIFWNQVLPKRRSDVMQARPSFESLRPHMSALIQPPFAAQALHSLYEACGDRVYLGELYARVRRHHEWLAQNRDFDGDGLLTIISPFESGMDWKPSYDAVLGYRKGDTPRRLSTSPLYWKGVGVDFRNFLARYDLQRIKAHGRFRVKDAGINAIYAVDLECMERLAVLAGDDPAIFARRRKRVLDSLLRLSYDAEAAAFFDVQEPGSKKLRVLTPTIFFPLAIPELEAAVADRLIDRHLVNPDEFATPLPVPSVALGERAFFRGETPFIWRGPTWAVTNWFLYHALRKRGADSHAERLHRSLSSLVSKSGFREYYDPISGDGHGAVDFTWSTLLIDMSPPDGQVGRER